MRRTLLKSILICGLAGIFYCYEYVLRISPNVMLNDLMLEFDIRAGAVGNLAAFFYYAYTPLQLPAGFLLDRFGSRRMLTFAALCCALGTLLFSSTTVLEMAQFGRFLVGFGSAFALLGVLKLSATWIPSLYFPMMVGLIITFGTLGAMFGNIVMSWVNQGTDWKTIQYTLAFIGFLLTPLMWFVIVDSPAKPKSINYMVSHLKDHSFPNSVPDKDYKQIWKDTLQLAQNKMIWINALIGCLLYLPTSVFNELWGHSCLLTVHGLCDTTAASAISMTFLGWAIGSPIAGILSSKLGKRKLLLQIASVVTFLLFSIILFLPNLSEITLHVLLFLFGLFASPQILVFAIAKDKCKPELLGTVFAFNNFVIMMGGLIGQPLVGKILDFYLIENELSRVPVYPASSYILALSLLPLGLITAFCLTTVLKEEKI